jgi:hypothetical protein
LTRTSRWVDRTGDQFNGSHSQDGGKTWIDLKVIQATLPSKVKVGITAGHSSNTGFTPTFENLTIEKPGEEKKDGK